MAKERQSNFELLRIVSMFLIVLSHFSVHGTYQSPNYSTSEQMALDILRIGGKLGSNIFVMIGAYFLVDKRFKVERVISIIVQVWLYAVGILTVTTIFLHLAKIGVYQSILPFPDTYWFATTYILLLLFIPVLNRIINLVGKKGLEYILWTLIIIWIILPSFKLTTFGLINFTWFAFLYLAVSYIKLYADNKLSSVPWGIVGLMTLVLTILTIFWFHMVSHYIPEKLSNSIVQLNQNGLLTVILSFSLFFMAHESKVFVSPIINYLGSLTFAVYLIHEHPIMRGLIWRFVDNQRFTGFFTMLLLGIGIAFVVYVLTLLVSMLTEKLLQPIIHYLTKRIANFVEMVLAEVDAEN